MSAILCSQGDDDAVTTCPRCEAPLCGMHRPARPELRCCDCEIAWEKGAWKRNVLLFPIAIVGCLLAMGIDMGVMWLIELGSLNVEAGGPGALVAMIGFPVGLAIALVRWVSKHTFRRRWLTRGAKRIPVATVVR